MWRKLIWLPVWGVTSVMVLFVSLAIFVNEGKNGTLTSPLVELGMEWGAPEFVYSAIPADEGKIKTAVGSADARAEILRQYLAKHNSPLIDYVDLLVEVADENGFDFRWMVAIAQQESNLCKKIPANSHNCWGWGIYGDKVTRFESYDVAIRKIAPQFGDKFLVKGADTSPEEMMQTYAPPSAGSWAFGVNQFMGEME